MKSRFEEFKDKTNEELIQLFNENDANNGIDGKYNRYADLSQLSKQNPNRRKHGDHKREEVKDSYNEL